MTDNVTELDFVKKFPTDAEMANRVLATCYLYDNLGVSSVLGCIQQVKCRTTDDITEEEELLVSAVIEVLDDYDSSEAVKDGCLNIIQMTIWADQFLEEG